MKKKGFTLVELLGVVAILAIVLGMTIIGYINVNNGMKKHYYEGVEESALMSATDYYTYNKNAMPTTFGEPSVISFKELVEQSRNRVYKTVNTEMINLYWNIGKSIVEKQNGNTKAKYGDNYIFNEKF